MKASDYLDGLPAAASLTAVELRFDEARASAFAKQVAGDFNPLHDVGNKRFCVPGDLLFAALIEHYGLHADTSVSFANMLGAHSRLRLPPSSGGRLHLADERGREVVGFFTAGHAIGNPPFAARLVEEYVRFSGRTFPGILMPLMQEAGVMMNPARPLIIYKDMAIRLDAEAVRASLDDTPAGQAEEGATLTLDEGRHAFTASGKKGAASVRFTIRRGGRALGDGEKNFVLSGLREYDADAVKRLLADHAARLRDPALGGSPEAVPDLRSHTGDEERRRDDAVAE